MSMNMQFVASNRRKINGNLKNRTSSIKYNVLILVFILAILLYISFSIADIKYNSKWKPSEMSSHGNRIEEFYQKLHQKKSQCELPSHLSAFDEFVIPFLRSDSLTCHKRNPITYVDYDKGLLLYTKAGRKSGLFCYYSWLYRFNDSYSNVSDFKLLPNSGVVFSNENYIARVRCFTSVISSTSQLAYVNVHLWVPDYERTEASGPSVLILVIESLSRFSFQRSMIKTKHAMERLNDFTILEGLMKVGENSFPNSMALLTGHAISKGSYDPGYWDNKYDYIWRHFKQQGYVTAFVEDFVVLGLFNYLRRGFKNQPTDFYPRPYWLQTFIKNASNYDELMSDKTHFCYGYHGSKAEMFLEQIFQFSKKMSRNDQPYFMYSFMSQFTHQDINNFNYIDKEVAMFIEKMSNYLSNTIFIIMGDHGPRYGPYVDSPMGTIESRLPLFAIRIPDKLNEKHEHLRRVVELNTKSIISWFDIHKLLLDISQNNFEFEEKTILTPLNVLRHLVPPERTCDDAKIKKQFCVCNGKFEASEWEIGYSINFAILDFLLILKKLISIISSDFKSCAKIEDMRKSFTPEIILPHRNETFFSVERLNITVLLVDTNSSLSAVIKRKKLMKKLPDLKWSNWGLDIDYVNVTQLEQKLEKLLCERI